MTSGAPPDERTERAATGYVVWPLAALDLFREPPDANAWSRLHVRQAFVFGLAAASAYLIVLALPLLIVLALPSVGVAAVEWLYVLGILLDLAGAVAWTLLALGYRRRALRGELFAIPLVTPIADRWLRVER